MSLRWSQPQGEGLWQAGNLKGTGWMQVVREACETPQGLSFHTVLLLRALTQSLCRVTDGQDATPAAADEADRQQMASFAEFDVAHMVG
jgi:hypothetical protein